MLTNHFPPRTAARRLALIDDMVPRTVPGLPTYDADRELLKQLLAHAGLDYDACFHGYVATGEALTADLARYQPHFILCLDRQLDKKVNGLRLLHGDWRPIDSWRGSVLLATGLVPGVKCMGTYHPSRLRLEYTLTAHARFDMRRVAEELRTDTLDVPLDDIAIDLSKEQLIARLREIYDNDLTCAADIEGYPDYVTCTGFATSANRAFVVPFVRADGTSWWSEEDEIELWEWVAKVLEKPTVKKRMHNGLYELFVLAWSYGIVIEGFDDDTMVLWFEGFCELEKSLGFVTSILTKHPAYKHERKATDDTTQLRYNGKDCCRTYEICDKMLAILKPRQMEHYRFNMSLLAPLNFMSLRGIRYDADAAKARLEETQNAIYELQDEINREAATSEARPALQTFYAALGHVAGGTGTPMGAPGGGLDDATRQRHLVALLADAFCCAPSLRRERRTVTETTWQPMRWNGKKWVKAGKRISTVEELAWTGEEPPPADAALYWAKPVRKQVERLFPVAIETVEDVRRFALVSQKEACARACKLLAVAKLHTGDGGLPAAQRGELATLLGIAIKVNATSEGGDAQWYLYEHCGLPKQFQKEGNNLTDKLASDDEAIIKAWVSSGKTKEKRDPRALQFLKLRRLITQTKYLVAKPDPDGRIRSAVNLVATPTCRMAMYGSPTGTSDLNLQTIGKKLRGLFLADEGCYLGQKDLDNSDAWTVAAHCAMLGDPTMLEDAKAKLKPAKILALIYAEGPAINKLDRAQLKVECAKVDGEGWLYFACKRVLHGSNYGMGKLTMANQILTDSYKLLGDPVFLSPGECERIQVESFFVRYPGVQRWHAWMKQQIAEAGQLVASSGFVRRIFGRKDSHDTLKECLSHFPQYFTTRAIKLALMRQWNDAENRRADGSLIVEPLLLVHDSKLSQWRVEDTEFAKRKEHEWWQNEQLIAQERIIIPASGTFGPSWGEQHESL